MNWNTDMFADRTCVNLKCSHKKHITQRLSQWMWSLSFYKPAARLIAILWKYTSFVVQNVSASIRSPPYVKYKPRYGWFCKWKFVDPYQKMDEKNFKNWNCKWKRLQIVIFIFGIILNGWHPDSQYTVPAFRPIFPQAFCAKFSLRNESQTFLDFMNDLLITLNEIAS